ncbi:MAG: ABC transporter ATP-binding protein [Verrucomicrobia bacterium]|nr:MAG: ABC transporter ATP-binding protein [Verrucomicrobiota bacterium]
MANRRVRKFSTFVCLSICCDRDGRAPHFSLRARLPGLPIDNSRVPPIALVNLTKNFRAAHGSTVCAVRNLSLSLASGELVTLIGPSGCGKTTTLRLLAGLESPDGGKISIGERDVTSLPPLERDVAMVFQHHALFPHLTTAENLSFGLKLRGVSRTEISSRVAEMSALLGLNGCLSRKPAELSGGERQRVALGRALIRRPGVLLLDEPFANLDAPLRRELRRELLRLHRERSLTTLLVTHDQAEAVALGQRVAVMFDGAIEQVATPEKLRLQPTSARVAEFLDPRVV